MSTRLGQSIKQATTKRFRNQIQRPTFRYLQTESPAGRTSKGSFDGHNVAIVGGGLGGLTLARLLHVHGIHATVYEAETSAHARVQGGQLDIHDYNGQVALKAAGLYEKFLDKIHVGAEATRIMDKAGNILFDQPDDGKGARPEILRGDLRQILLDSLPPDTVRWGCKVSKVKSLNNGRHEVAFVNGSSITSNLLVGADGAWSKVRSLLSDAKPEYVGATSVEMFLFDCENRHKELAQMVGQGALFALSPGKSIVVHREANNILHIYLVIEKPKEWLTHVQLSNRTSVIAELSKEFVDWAPVLRALVTESDTNPVFRPLHKLPVNHRWERMPGVTLLGDAAHLSPPDGEGANFAMYDGAQRAKSIVEHPHDIEAALKSYEAELFSRTESTAVEAVKMFDVCFGNNTPQSLVDFFRFATESA